MPPKSKKTTAAAAPAASTSEDVVMTEAVEETEAASFLEEQRIRVLPGSSATAASYEFKDEDHTLGNALRYIIMKNPNVEFCGYSIPHPSEPKMNVRIQTYDDYPAIKALEQGFDDLMDLCDVVADKFALARADFAVTGGGPSSYVMEETEVEGAR